MTRICNQTRAGAGAAAHRRRICLLLLVCVVDSNSPGRARAIGIAAACGPKLGATPDYLDRIISYLSRAGFVQN